MTEGEIFNALRNYRWAQLWRGLGAQENASPIETATRAFLATAWWQENALARTLLSALPKTANPDLLFLRALTQMCLGDGKSTPEILSQLKRLRAPSWQINWLSLEYLGRTAQYKEQSKLLKSLLEKQPTLEDYAFVACLQSLENPAADVQPIRQTLAAQTKLPPMGQVLAVRVGLYADDEAEAALKRIHPDEPAYAPALYRLGYLYARMGRVSEAIQVIDALAKTGQIDKPLISAWLSLCLSHAGGWSDTPARVRFAASLVPSNPRTLGQLASYLLIFFWVRGQYAEAYNLVKQHHAFLEMEHSDDDRMHRIFFRFVLHLAAAWQENRSLYHDESVTAPLTVIGESHCLSPANITIDWHGVKSKATSRFVMGVKMFHLGHPAPNQYQTCVRAHLDATSPDSHLLFAIGEIDCRPDEGIWRVHQKTGKGLEALVFDTVSAYVSWLDKQLAGRCFQSVTLQGVPAPGYPLKGKNDPGDEQAFLSMIRQVNLELEAAAKKQGWSFLDVYGATANDDGLGNTEWHLDGWHLKPIFYSNASKWLRR